MTTDDPKEPPADPPRRPRLTPECLTQPRFREAVATDAFTAAEAAHVRGCAWCSRALAALRAGAPPPRAEPRARAGWIDDVLAALADECAPTEYAILDLVVGGMTLAEAAARANVPVVVAGTCYRTALASIGRAIDAEPGARADFDAVCGSLR